MYICKKRYKCAKADLYKSKCNSNSENCKNRIVDRKLQRENYKLERVLIITDGKIVKYRFRLVIKLIINKYYKTYFAIYFSYC